MFWRAGSLWAAAFDPDALEVRGDPIRVVEGVAAPTLASTGYGLGADGTLAYTRAGTTAGDTLLVWVDREGNEEPVPAAPRPYDSVRLSPDGQQVVTQVLDMGAEPPSIDIFVYDLARNTPTRITFTPGIDFFPAWTIDGSRVVFASQRDGQWDLYVKAADGTGEVERLSTTVESEAPYSFSPDGKMLVLNAVREDTSEDVVARIGRSLHEALAEEYEEEASEPVRADKIGRNDPCPCGSGKKYKKCCGATVH